jgi:hypothetical protein
MLLFMPPYCRCYSDMYDDTWLHYGPAVTSQLFWLAPISDEILDVVTSKRHFEDDELGTISCLVFEYIQCSGFWASLRSMLIGVGNNSWQQIFVSYCLVSTHICSLLMSKGCKMIWALVVLYWLYNSCQA